MKKRYFLNRVVILLCCTLGAQIILAQNTVILQPGNSDGKDAWVWSYDPFENVNYGEANSSNSGLNNVIRSEVWIWGTGADTIRGLVDFDLSSIPSNASVTDAKLSLFYFVNTGFTQQTGQNELLIQRVNESWNETAVTWNNQPGTSVLNQVTLPRSSFNTQSYLDMNVTNLVQDMMTNPTTSHGFMLKMLNEVTFKGLTFASSEHPNAALHPKLEISYTSSTDIKDNPVENTSLLYPNPTEGSFVIEPGKEFEYAEMEITNVLGQQVIKTSLDGVRELTVLKDKPTGIYLVQLKTGDGKSEVVKVIKQ